MSEDKKTKIVYLVEDPSNSNMGISTWHVPVEITTEQWPEYFHKVIVPYYETRLGYNFDKDSITTFWPEEVTEITPQNVAVAWEGIAEENDLGEIYQDLDKKFGFSGPGKLTLEKVKDMIEAVANS
jgi:hypothetical protein